MTKQSEIEKRAIKHGKLFIEKNATIRSVAKETGSNKSTVHLDLHRLKEIHPALFEKVEQKLNYNFAVKHIRGGESCRKYWEKKKK
jgi:hypothetical protein